MPSHHGTLVGRCGFYLVARLSHKFSRGVGRDWMTAFGPAKLAPTRPARCKTSLSARLMTCGSGSYGPVKVTTPAEDYKDGDTVLVCSGAKIGGGPAPYRKQRYHQLQADLGSTG